MKIEEDKYYYIKFQHRNYYEFCHIQFLTSSGEIFLFKSKRNKYLEVGYLSDIEDMRRPKKWELTLELI